MPKITQGILTGLLLVFLSNVFAETRGLSLVDVKIWDMLEKNAYALYEKSSQLAPQEKDSLWINGHKSMRVVVGEGGSEVQQELRLQMQGEVAAGWYLEGLLVDEGLSVGELRVSTLQDVSAMYLRLYKGNVIFTLGETEFNHEGSFLDDFSHATAGFSLKSAGKKVKSQVALGQSSAHTKTTVFQGYDGQRQGYLVGENNEFVAVVPNSETVWWQGKKLERGVDYRMEYVGGVLDFLGSNSPSSRDEVVVTYEEWEEDSGRDFLGIDLLGKWKYANIRASVIDITGDSLVAPRGLMLAGAAIKPTSFLWLESELFHNPYQQANLWSYNLGSDSGWQANNRNFAFSVQGMHLEEGFSALNFNGLQNYWNNHILQRHWYLKDLDSAESKNYQQLRWGLRPGANLNTRIDWGYKYGEDWNAQRWSWLWERKTTKSKVDWELAHIDSWQKQQQSSGWQSSLNMQTYLNNLQIYGGVFGAQKEQPAKAEHYEWELNSGIKSDFWLFQDLHEDIKWEGVAQLKNKYLVDSMQRMVWTQSFNMGEGWWRWNSFVQGQWWLHGNEYQQNYMGASEQRLDLWHRAWELNLLHRMDLTAEQLFRPVYKKVEPGLGDVVWDSLSGEFIEGVDQGDYIFDGSIRDDSLAAIRTADAQFSADLWWFPREQFAVRHGILADLSLGASLLLHGRDTTKLWGSLPWKKSHLNNLVDGLYGWSLKTRWHPSSGKLNALLSWGSESQRSGGTYAGAESRGFQQIDLHWQLHKNLRWQGFGEREQVERTLPNAMRWTSWSQKHYLFWDFKTHWVGAPSFRWQQSDGASLWGNLHTKLWIPGLLIQWQPYGLSVASIEYGWAYLQSADALTPYRLSQGYAPGITHRIELTADYAAKDGLLFSLSYLLRGDASAWFQKLSGEAHLDF
ncbi:MAG: hypothetical protein GX801_01870 [Fibrobacter sp.]|nr:hypothetical protein [Fibrobacter sp.]